MVTDELLARWVNLESEAVQASLQKSSAEQALAAVQQRIEEFCSGRVRHVRLVVHSVTVPRTWYRELHFVAPSMIYSKVH